MQTGKNNNNDATGDDKNISRKKPSAANNLPYRILLVDDNNDILITIKKGLEDNGFKVDAFSNPLEVLSYFKPNIYDLLLIDIKMTQMNGFELYQEIRKISNDRDIKACFITAYDVYYELLKKDFPGLNVGCFIRKPIEIDDLIKKINEELQ